MGLEVSPVPGEKRPILLWQGHRVTDLCGGLKPLL